MTRTPDDQHAAGRDPEHPEVPRQGDKESPVFTAGTAGAVVSTGPSSLAIFLTVAEQGPLASVGFSIVMMIGASVAVTLPALSRRARKRNGKK